MAITPADSQKCANEIAAKKPFVVLSSLNFFGNHFAIYKAANIPVIVGTPITALDFTSPGVYAIGNGGGCLGTHTGLVEFITKDLGKKKIGVPWADTPPGVFCYHDLEKKPLEVLAGKTLKGTEIKAEGNKAKGTIPDLDPHRRGHQARPGRRDPAGHPGPRLQAGRHHLLGPGRRLLDVRELAGQARLEGLDDADSCCRRPASTSPR